MYPLFFKDKWILLKILVFIMLNIVILLIIRQKEYVK